MNNDDEEARTIWCGNLSEKVTNDILYELFHQAGPLERVVIPNDREGRQRNYGYIVYTSEESAEYAVELFEGTALFNRKLNMRLQKRRHNNNPNYQQNFPIHPYSNDFNGASQGYQANLQMNPAAIPDFGVNNPELEMKFMEMTNQMISEGAAIMPFMPQMNFGSYQQHSMSTHQHSSSSPQDQWISRHHPYDNKNNRNNKNNDSNRDRNWQQRNDRDVGRRGNDGYDSRRDRGQGNHRRNHGNSHNSRDRHRQDRHHSRD